MMFKYPRSQLPVAFSMIEIAKKLKQMHPRPHAFVLYFFWWAAFNNIYTTIAFNAGNRATLKRKNGQVEWRQDGSVRVPKVNSFPERDQIICAIKEFDDDLTRKLIVHPSTEFFVNRPLWTGEPLTLDANGQRLNGVLNINHSFDTADLVWSPIDIPAFESYRQNAQDIEAKKLLTKQIVFVLYTIRCNMMHGGKNAADRNDVNVVEKALPLLQIIVESFIVKEDLQIPAAPQIHAIEVRFTQYAMIVRLSDGREISVPLEWFPRLRDATPEQRNNWRFIAKGIGMHWEDIDEDFAVSTLLRM